MIWATLENYEGLWEHKVYVKGVRESEVLQEQITFNEVRRGSSQMSKIHMSKIINISKSKF